ncbi:MAG: restriction endonuclease subunit S, partial [Chloroflexota bacterium]
LPGPTTVNSSIAVLKPDKDINGVYLYYYLKSKYIQSIISRVKDGMGVPHLFQSDIREFNLIVPSIQEQQTIANFLDTKCAEIDALITEKERLVELLHEKRRTLISHAVTKGLDPAVPMKPSGIEWIGDIPAHWNVRKFRYCASISSGQVDPRQEPYAQMFMIAPNHIESGTGRLLQLETANEQGAESGKYIYKAGCVIYSKIRPELRKVCIATVDGLCSADMYPLTPNQHVITAEFLLFSLLSEGFSQFAILESMRVAMPKINRESLNDCYLVLPPMEEQNRITKTISEQTALMESTSDEITQSIQHLQEYRTALISAAVTGKIDVRGWDA